MKLELTSIKLTPKDIEDLKITKKTIDYYTWVQRIGITLYEDENKRIMLEIKNTTFLILTVLSLLGCIVLFRTICFLIISLGNLW